MGAIPSKSKFAQKRERIKRALTKENTKKRKKLLKRTTPISLTLLMSSGKESVEKAMRKEGGDPGA